MGSRRAYLARRLPFYYGWIVFALVAGTNYAARPLMSVAVLSVFMLPMTETFGWSRGLLSGAVSLGDLCGVVISPGVGRLLDKYGAGVLMSVASAVAGACAFGLGSITQVWTLPMQLVGQALGPVTAGFLFDVTGGYQSAFLGFTGVVILGSILVVTAVPPHRVAGGTP